MAFTRCVGLWFAWEPMGADEGSNGENGQEDLLLETLCDRSDVIQLEETCTVCGSLRAFEVSPGHLVCASCEEPRAKDKMKFFVDVRETTSESDDHDAWFPFVAVADHYGIRFRGVTAKEAADNVVGAMLHMLGDREAPPREIEFVIGEVKS